MLLVLSLFVASCFLLVILQIMKDQQVHILELSLLIMCVVILVNLRSRY